jgi:hypothetical protein
MVNNSRKASKELANAFQLLLYNMQIEQKRDWNAIERAIKMQA